MPTRSTQKGQASKPVSQPAQTNKKRKADPKAQKFYAVRAGFNPGVYLTYAECQEQTAGFAGALFRAFENREDAVAYAAGKKVPSAADGEEKFYAIARGREPGIYTDWESASLVLKGSKAPKFKKFPTRAEAVEYIRTHGDEAAQEAIQDEGAEPPSKKSKRAAVKEELDVTQVWTDGSSRGNGKLGASAGVGVYFGANDPRNVSERLGGELQTNQRAELTAILRALEIVPVKQSMRIHSDSRYCISCVTEWYVGWGNNGWKTKTKEDVKNKDLVIAIRARIDARDEAGAKTYFQFVKGHATDIGNNAADELATQAAMKRLS
ncbi:ribonuclease H [Biscogniauxia marginata]|nr:ribonuclease H [Biscogniauxia marginata]